MVLPGSGSDTTADRPIVSNMDKGTHPDPQDPVTEGGYPGK